MTEEQARKMAEDLAGGYSIREQEIYEALLAVDEAARREEREKMARDRVALTVDAAKKRILESTPMSEFVENVYNSTMVNAIRARSSKDGGV